MIRDFSKEANENIDSINPASSYEGIWDYLSDAKGSTKEWIWKLSIAGLLDGVDSYHRGDYKAMSIDYGKVNAYVRAGISDIYGGVTNNLIVGNRGHLERDKDDDDKDGNIWEYTYWYDIDSVHERKERQETEMWAHYFSFGITGNDEAVNDMRIYLSNTMERYDEMAQNMTDSL